MATDKDNQDALALKGPEALFKPDEQLEEAGVFLDYGDFRIKITRAGATNRRFRQVMSQKMKPHRRAMSNDTMSNDLAERVTREVWAETIVLGWDSALGKDKIPYKGAAYQFSKENCVALFKDLPDLFIDVREQSMKLGLFIDENEDLELGN